jgi:hypothetical protein
MQQCFCTEAAATIILHRGSEAWHRGVALDSRLHWLGSSVGHAICESALCAVAPAPVQNMHLTYNFLFNHFVALALLDALLGRGAGHVVAHGGGRGSEDAVRDGGGLDLAQGQSGGSGARRVADRQVERVVALERDVGLREKREGEQTSNVKLVELTHGGVAAAEDAGDADGLGKGKGQRAGALGANLGDHVGGRVAGDAVVSALGDNGPRVVVEADAEAGELVDGHAGAVAGGGVVVHEVDAHVAVGGGVADLRAEGLLDGGQIGALVAGLLGAVGAAGLLADVDTLDEAAVGVAAHVRQSTRAEEQSKQHTHGWYLGGRSREKDEIHGRRLRRRENSRVATGRALQCTRLQAQAMAFEEPQTQPPTLHETTTRGKTTTRAKQSDASQKRVARPSPCSCESLDTPKTHTSGCFRNCFATFRGRRFDRRSATCGR